MARQGTYLGGSTLLTFGRRRSSESGWEPESIENRRDKKRNRPRHAKKNIGIIKESKYIKQLTSNDDSVFSIFHISHNKYMTTLEFIFHEYMRLCAISDFFNKPRPKIPNSIIFYDKPNISRKMLSRLIKHSNQYRETKLWLHNWRVKKHGRHPLLSKKSQELLKYYELYIYDYTK
jgi:hypothetical protein